jgi:hypothetical protein
MHPVVIAVYLRTNTLQHSNSSIGGRPMNVIGRFSIMRSWKDDELCGSYPKTDIGSIRRFPAEETSSCREVLAGVVSEATET